MRETKTERLLLRPFSPDDFEAVLAYRSDMEVMRFITGRPETQEEVKAMFVRLDSYLEVSPQEKYRVAIELRETGQLIGGCGLDITSHEHREAELGYHLNRDFWGKGYTVEASLPLLRFGFEELGLHRIFAQCVAVNRGSARVMEKLGMQFEGRSRESFLQDGVWYDDLKYAILEQEWRALHPSVPPESA